MNVGHAFERTPRLAVVTALAATGLLALIDKITGVEISFSIFYLLPVSLAAWYAGERAGLALSVACALTWGLIDASGHAYSHAVIGVWNGAMRGMFFAIVSLLMVRVKESLRRERAAHERLAQAYDDLDHTRSEQLQVKDRLLSHVSHELRTPLTALHQFLTIVLDRIPGELNDRQEEYLRIAVRNADSLSEMISDLLDATRVDAGKLSISPAPTAAAGVVADVLRTLRSRAAEAGVALVADPLDDLPLILVDPGRLRQVLVNLVDNAIKFSSSGSTVRIRGAMEPGDDGLVRLSVTDTGPGLSLETQERLFGRMYQGAAQPEGARKGLGLGLYICKELVTRQGGRIWVESTPGEGATFSFALPAVRPAAAAAAAREGVAS